MVSKPTITGGTILHWDPHLLRHVGAFDADDFGCTRLSGEEAQNAGAYPAFRRWGQRESIAKP